MQELVYYFKTLSQHFPASTDKIQDITYNSRIQKTNFECVEVKDREFIATQSLVPIVSLYIRIFAANLSERNHGKRSYVSYQSQSNVVRL
jgi:hypothetical protein